jgi:hypothetical protein
MVEVEFIDANEDTTAAKAANANPLNGQEMQPRISSVCRQLPVSFPSLKPKIMIAGSFTIT